MANRQQKQNVTAIITDKKGYVLSVGKNSYVKTHPLMVEIGKKVDLPEKCFLHAEVDAIIKCRNLKDAHKIFVSRISKDGSYALAKPCPICQYAITKTGIKIVEWTV